MSLAKTSSSSAAIFKWHFAQKITFFLSPATFFSHPGTWLRNKRAGKKMWKLFKQFFIVKLTKPVTQWAVRVSQRFIIQFYSLLCIMCEGDEEKLFFTQDELHLTARHVIIGAKLCCRNLVFLVVVNGAREKRFDIKNPALRHSIEMKL